MNVTLTNGRTAETGCYVDGHWGVYGSGRMMDQCASLVDFDVNDFPWLEAFEVQPDDGVDSFDREVADEDVRWSMADELENALNAVTPHGYVWH